MIWDETSKRCLVVDPGMCTDWEWERIHRFIQQKELTPDAVLITHNHSDHVMGTGYLTKAYPGLPVYGSMEDQNHLPTIPMQNRFFGVDAEDPHAGLGGGEPNPPAIGGGIWGGLLATTVLKKGIAFVIEPVDRTSAVIRRRENGIDRYRVRVVRIGVLLSQGEGNLIQVKQVNA